MAPPAAVSREPQLPPPTVLWLTMLKLCLALLSDTPVIPPAWIGEEDFWLVFTQCCGNPRPPINHYNFNAQHVTLQKL